MKKGLIIILCLIWLSGYGQKNMYVGLNLAPLVLNTVSFYGEREMTPFFSLQLGTGFRIQGRPEGEPTRIKLLSKYVQFRNRGAFVSVGGRLYNRTEWDYPYFALDIIGSYFNEKILVPQNGGGSTVNKVDGFRLGGSATIGFVIRLAERLRLDLALQMGYTKPRTDVVDYYFTGMGYSTFGPSQIGVEGGHIQPILTLKYKIIQDKRERIRNMD